MIERCYLTKLLKIRTVMLLVNDKEYSPSQISAYLNKEEGESYLGIKVTDAVIVVPAYFNDS